jgi:hypothetical protein
MQYIYECVGTESLGRVGTLLSSQYYCSECVGTESLGRMGHSQAYNTIVLIVWVLNPLEGSETAKLTVLWF